MKKLVVALLTAALITSAFSGTVFAAELIKIETKVMPGDNITYKQDGKGILSVRDIITDDVSLVKNLVGLPEVPHLKLELTPNGTEVVRKVKEMTGLGFKVEIEGVQSGF